MSRVLHIPCIIADLEVNYNVPGDPREFLVNLIRTKMPVLQMGLSVNIRRKGIFNVFHNLTVTIALTLLLSKQLLEVMFRRNFSKITTFML